jgi:hypothetical protein
MDNPYALTTRYSDAPTVRMNPGASIYKKAAVASAVIAIGLGGAFWWYRKKHPVDAGYSTLPMTQDLEGAPRGHFQVAPDGAVEFRKPDGLGVLDWLTTQNMTPALDQTSGAPDTDAVTFNIDPTHDGSPIPPGASAKDFAVSAALAGFNVLVRPSLMVADGKKKQIKFSKGAHHAHVKNGSGWAVLVRADPKGIGTLPSLPAALPPMPGFPGKGASPAMPPGFALPGGGTMPGLPGLGIPSPVEKVLKPDTDPYANMPADMAAKVKDVLAKGNATPNDLDSLAKSLEKDFPDASVLVNKKATDLKANKALEQVTSGTALAVPFDQGESRRLAARLAGPDGKYTALRRMNPQLSIHTGGDLWPWVPGQVIRIPTGMFPPGSTFSAAGGN